ncbi:hypothetical protein [Paenibacillus eucommiae]|uniref:hypothetical protein n=1 Tax=Paenibacillus eucommiae TaxID=1355755 RepID=UPI001AE9CEB0|nr:hypothetical protein [Paenibacillus eucommiae]
MEPGNSDEGGPGAYSRTDNESVECTPDAAARLTGSTEITLSFIHVQGRNFWDVLLVYVSNIAGAKPVEIAVVPEVVVHIEFKQMS